MTVRLPPARTLDQASELRTIPGVRVRLSGVDAAWDAAPYAAAILGCAAPPTGPQLRLVREEHLNGVRGAHRLFKYQREDALSFARGDKLLEYACTGSGKSAIILAALDTLAAAERRPVRALIITGAKGRTAWTRDAAWIGDRSVAVILGESLNDGSAAAARRADRDLAEDRAKGAFCCATADLNAVIAATAADTVVVGWEVLLANDVKSEDRRYLKPEALCRGRSFELCQGRWDVIVLDEHHYAANWQSQRARAVTAIIDSQPRRPIVWGLTATPVPDLLRDWLTQLAHVAPESWNTFTQIGVRPEDGKPDWKPAFSVRHVHGGYGTWGEWDDSGPHDEKECLRCRAVGPARFAELCDRVGKIASVRSRASVAEYLPAYQRVIKKIPEDAALKVPFKRYGRGYEGRLAHAAAVSFEAVVESAVEQLIGNCKVVVLGNRIEWVNRIAVRIQEKASRVRRVRERLKVWVAHEDVGKRDVQAREYLAAADTALFVSTIDKVMESIQLHQTDHVHYGAIPWNYKQVTQSEGRYRRVGGRKVCYWYYVPLGTVAAVIHDNLLSKLDTVSKAGADTAGEVFDDAMKVPTEAEIRAKIDAFLEANAAAVYGAFADKEAE